MTGGACRRRFYNRCRDASNGALFMLNTVTSTALIRGNAIACNNSLISEFGKTVLPAPKIPTFVDPSQCVETWGELVYVAKESGEKLIVRDSRKEIIFRASCEEETKVTLRDQSDKLILSLRKEMRTANSGCEWVAYVGEDQNNIAFSCTLEREESRPGTSSVNISVTKRQPEVSTKFTVKRNLSKCTFKILYGEDVVAKSIVSSAHISNGVPLNIFTGGEKPFLVSLLFVIDQERLEALPIATIPFKGLSEIFGKGLNQMGMNAVLHILSQVGDAGGEARQDHERHEQIQSARSSSAEVTFSSRYRTMIMVFAVIVLMGILLWIAIVLVAAVVNFMMGVLMVIGMAIGLLLLVGSGVAVIIGVWNGMPLKFVVDGNALELTAGANFVYKFSYEVRSHGAYFGTLKLGYGKYNLVFSFPLGVTAD